MEPPPLLPDIRENLLEYLINPENLPIYEYERNQEYWPRKANPSQLLHYDSAPLSTTLKMHRNLNTGEIIEFREVSIPGAGNTAQNSMSFNRAPVASGSSEFSKGSISNFPFWPSGFPNLSEELNKKGDVLSHDNLLTVPPGFSNGLEFEDDCCTIKTERDDIPKVNKVLNKENVVNLMDILQKEDDFFGLWKSEQKEEQVEATVQVENADLPEEDVIPKEIPILKITQPAKVQQTGTEWAVLLDTSRPVTDFRKRIPEMAVEYSFELDNFQKLAILQLEQHNHVFVAAHTSAGKTVVAEYAIALSQKHMTRTIYTSPIKALSNQKYRDFKQKFGDVGLITGDFQINVKAACLIMTTEILRSMLYGGSEITRDLEYVIFDEVHYINDKERGHVWEQVLIMLPAHVCVVLLSATVPNTIEFADWLGRTYQKKVYVVTTYKRPVPLQHYLYTGCGGNTKDNRFLILDSNGEFNMQGYNKATESMLRLKDKDKSKKKDGYKPFGGPKRICPKTEKLIWSGLVDHLNRHELLPVVAFTFSRNRCDFNAESLKHLDLTTESEKFHIEVFFKKCIKSLKAPDRELPQIVHMFEILRRGIGVHHSGILPIMKEMIEMLFQKQLVKLLFATETFAMGVNMPARTVVFDSIVKHDGREMRHLKPAEYIQMAGRAGRRGLDETGTVIILCKEQVEPQKDLKSTMLGKPSQLQSQFRITYGMVLTLLRVESLSVESMMSRSFREADFQKKLEDIREKLKKVELELVEETTKELNDYMQPLVQFYNAANTYLEYRQEVLPEIIMSHQVGKELIPGRILLITHDNHINKLALLLNSSLKSSIGTYKVLVLTDDNVVPENKNDLWYKMLALSSDEIFNPQVNVGHAVLTINPIDIFEITSKVIKIDTDIIVKDWDKRQILRFKDDPPGPTCNSAIRELLKITLNTALRNDCNDRACFLDFVYDLKVNQLELTEKIMHMYKLRDNLLAYTSSTKISNFEVQFLQVFTKKFLENEKAYLQFELSYSSMSLYPEYEKRIKILRHLNYVNSQNRVELKGKVACEMGMNELLITELVLRNILANFNPAEVAALLSALVFQAKSRVEPNLTESLKKGILEIQAVYDEIQTLESAYGVDKISDTTTNLNFGLVEVVYEWANAKPFSNIMMLTDIQEGIIVRCIQQLNETICNVRSVARLTGDPKLQSKMEEASTAIKRDIVFAESLYTLHENH